MIISCPQCGTGYDMPDSAGLVGRKVRCRACRTVWRVEAPAAAEPAVVPQKPGAAAANDDAPKAATQAAPPARPKAAADAADFGWPAWPEWPDQAETPPTAGGKTQRPSAGDGPGLAAASQLAADAAGDPGGPTGSISASIERRRQARQRSSFDDVEAALAAVRSAPANGAGGTADGQFFDASAPGTRESDREFAARQQQNFNPADGRQDFGADEDDSGLFAGNEGFADEKSANRAATIIGWVALAATLAGLATFAYLGAETIVRKLPGAAPLYAALGTEVNVRGLEFNGVGYRWQLDSRGRPVLSISGEVKNISATPRAVPSVVFAFLDQEGLELFDWATPMRSGALLPGATAPFTSIVPVPSEVVRKVEVRFAKGRR